MEAHGTNATVSADKPSALETRPLLFASLTQQDPESEVRPLSLLNLQKLLRLECLLSSLKQEEYEAFDSRGKNKLFSNEELNKLAMAAFGEDNYFSKVRFTKNYPPMKIDETQEKYEAQKRGYLKSTFEKL